MKTNDDNIDLTAQNYQPLSPFKFLDHPDRLQQFIQTPYSIPPVTAHLVPTLYCNQKCYFCTYGQYKENGCNSVFHMKEIDLLNTVDQLAKAGIKSAIFTGGGEPTLHPSLTKAMKLAKNNGMDVALNSNGSRLSERLIQEILETRPCYIRISINNANPVSQKLVTGQNNFDQVMVNFQKLVEMKTTLSPETDISVGFVVTVVNLYEMSEMVERLIKIEKEIQNLTGFLNPIFSIQFRPVSNFSHSKHLANNKRINSLLQHLKETRGDEDEEELRSFLYEGSQSSPTVIKKALEIIKNDICQKVIENNSNIKIVYPEKKFVDLIKQTHKPYDKCLSCGWYLFIWPDGSLYSCVEWAGDPRFSIGNLFTEPLTDILNGSARQEMMNRINTHHIKNDCVPICAHHEMNIILNQYVINCQNHKNNSSTQTVDLVTKHNNFL